MTANEQPHAPRCRQCGRAKNAGPRRGGEPSALCDSCNRRARRRARDLGYALAEAIGANDSARIEFLARRVVSLTTVN